MGEITVSVILKNMKYVAEIHARSGLFGLLGHSVLKPAVQREINSA